MHKQKVHSEPEVWKCDLCPKEYMQRDGLNNHKQSHNPEKVMAKRVTCDICGKVLQNKHLLERHKLSHDEKRPKFKCDICDNVVMDLEKHKKTHLAVTKKWQCDHYKLLC